MILIFDYFETILNTKSMDFNRGLYMFWESYYREKCPFEARENMVFIGDIYETDVVGAHNAGIKSAWLNKKNGNDENGWATYNIASADQLITILEGEYEY